MSDPLAQDKLSRGAFADALAGLGFGFESVAREDLRALCGLSQVIETPAEASLFERDGKASGLYFVARGRYELSLEAPGGRRQIVRIVESHKLITEGLASAARGCRVDCKALDHAAAWHLPASELLASSRSSPEIGVAMMRVLAHRQGRLLDLIYDLSLRGVEQRLAAFLTLMVSHEADGAVEHDHFDISRSLPVQTVAEMLGTTRAEVTRAQASLQKAGLIEVGRDRVRVLRLADLRAHG